MGLSALTFMVHCSGVRPGAVRGMLISGQVNRAISGTLALGLLIVRF